MPNPELPSLNPVLIKAMQAEHFDLTCRLDAAALRSEAALKAYNDALNVQCQLENLQSQLRRVLELSGVRFESDQPVPSVDIAA